MSCDERRFRLPPVIQKKPQSFRLIYQPCCSKTMARSPQRRAKPSSKISSCCETRTLLRPSSASNTIPICSARIYQYRSRLLKSLFPLLPRTTSSTLRSFIRKTILSDIRNANIRSKNHKLNRAVQAMLFGMVERGMDGEVVGDKGKLRASSGPTTTPAAHNGEEAMWAVILTKELWRKGIW